MNTSFIAPEWNENSSVDVLNDTIASLQGSQKELSKKLESQEALLVNELFETYKNSFENIKATQFIGAQLQISSGEHLKKLANQLCAMHENALVILTAETGGKANVALAISEHLASTKNWQAPAIIKEKIAPLIKGGGGGQKTLATAGGQDASQLSEVITVIKFMLN